jgi:hypothetical protein
MKNIKLFLSIALFTTLVGSCSTELRPFTSGLMNEGKWSDDDLKRIQFYLSDDIVIYRDFTKGETQIVGGVIKIVNGREVEEIRIPKGTSGVFLSRLKNENFAIGFDASSNTKYLTFGPNPNRGGAYVLLAAEWKNKRGKLTYDNKAYFANTSAAWAALLVDLKNFRNMSVQTQTVKGRKV